MTQGTKVHKGYCVTPGSDHKEPTARVETAITLKPGPAELVDGLGSRFARFGANMGDADAGVRPADLPESLTQREIAKICRQEVLSYGRDGLDS